MRAELIQRLNEAVEAGDWDRAVEILSRALQRAKPSEQGALKEHLAQCLNARAVRNVNDVSTRLESVMRERQQVLPQVIDALLSRNFADASLQRFFERTDLRASPSREGSDSAKERSRTVPYVAVLFVAGAIFAAFSIVRGFRETWTWFVPVCLVLTALYLLARLLAPVPSKISSYFKKLATPPVLLTPPYQPYDNRPPCRVCGGKAEYQYTIEGHGNVELCGGCAGVLRSILESTPKLDPDDSALLISAREDLEQAAGLDPGLAEVRENLEAVNGLLGQFNIT